MKKMSPIRKSQTLMSGECGGNLALGELPGDGRKFDGKGFFFILQRW